MKNYDEILEGLTDVEMRDGFIAVLNSFLDNNPVTANCYSMYFKFALESSLRLRREAFGETNAIERAYLKARSEIFYKVAIILAFVQFKNFDALDSFMDIFISILSIQEKEKNDRYPDNRIYSLQKPKDKIDPIWFGELDKLYSRYWAVLENINSTEDSVVNYLKAQGYIYELGLKSLYLPVAFKSESFYMKFLNIINKPIIFESSGSSNSSDPLLRDRPLRSNENERE